MSVYLSSTNLQVPKIPISSYILMFYRQLKFPKSSRLFKSFLKESPLVRSNSFVLFALDTLLLDCQFPCVWTNSTTFSPESKSRNGPSTVARPRGCCSSVVSQEFLKTGSSRNSQ